MVESRATISCSCVIFNSAFSLNPHSRERDTHRG
jgi:hypothetical protein